MNDSTNENIIIESKVKQAILVGIGGTGAKCVEAVVHLAASGHAPSNIYPILIDQDRKNGNVFRCKNVLQAYNELSKNGIGPREWFFSSTINLYDKLLPLVPQEESQNYGAAIGFPSMSMEEQAVVRALFLQRQLNELLDSGYKKRAHMGSLLMEKMLEREDKKTINEEGLKLVIDKLRNIQEVHVVLFGSLFGGTGASGLIRIGKYFKEKMSDAIIKGVFLTPYFIISDGSKHDADSDLVKSNADMQAVKIALEMYKSEIEKSFNYVYIIGSEIKQLGGEFVTRMPYYGGTEQENPAHVFELIAALVPNEKPSDQTQKFYTFIADTEKKQPPLIFSISKKYNSDKKNSFLSGTNTRLLLNPRRLAIVKDFATMLYKVQEHKDSWWRRQPWADIKFKTSLVNWALRHHSWWKEMSYEEWNNHTWSKFQLHFDTQISEYGFSALLSMHIGKKSPSQLANLFETIDSLEKYKIRSLKWAST